MAASDWYTAEIASRITEHRFGVVPRRNTTCSTLNACTFLTLAPGPQRKEGSAGEAKMKLTEVVWTCYWTTKWWTSVSRWSGRPLLMGSDETQEYMKE